MSYWSIWLNVGRCFVYCRHQLIISALNNDIDGAYTLAEWDRLLLF
jgi:hypothetical protein